MVKFPFSTVAKSSKSTESRCVVENLESRQLMSATVFAEEALPRSTPEAGIEFEQVGPRAELSRAAQTRASVTRLRNNVAVNRLSGRRGSQRMFRITVPAGATNLVLQMSGGRGDADIYVRYGATPTTSSWEHRPYTNHNNETVSINTPRAGTYYIMIRGYTAYSGVSLKAKFTTGAVNPPNNQTPGQGDGRRETWAVLLGASDYAGTSNDLPDCAADANNMSILLRNRLGVDANHQRVFTGGSHISESLISQSMSWFRQNADADDVIVFYYSGHGSFGSQEYVNDDETLALPSGEYFSESELQAQLQTLPSGTDRIVMLDSCYSGGFTGLASTVSNTMVLASSRFDQVSFGYFQGGTPNNIYGGIFTSWFTHGYNQNRGDANGDGRVTMAEAFNFARPNVGSVITQNPVMAGNVTL